MSTPETHCDNCGAPFENGLASCGFCDMPIVGRSSGVRCPSCGELSTADRRSCAHCAMAFTKGCVFCGKVAFLTATACPGCNEAFVGAEDRKAQRDAEARQRATMDLAAQGIGAIGQIATSRAGQSLIESLTGSHAGGSESGVLGDILDAVLHSNDRK